MKVAQKVAKAAMKAFAADGVTMQQFNEGAGGQVVFHLHVHIIPRKTGVAMKPPASEKEKPDVLAEQRQEARRGDRRRIICALMREQKAAQQQRRLAGQHADKHRALHRQEGQKSADRRAHPHGERNSRPARRRENRISLAMTPARIAVATARDHTTISESSLSPRASTRPSTRQISFGR